MSSTDEPDRSRRARVVVVTVVTLLVVLGSVPMGVAAALAGESTPLQCGLGASSPGSADGETAATTMDSGTTALDPGGERGVAESVPAKRPERVAESQGTQKPQVTSGDGFDGRIDLSDADATLSGRATNDSVGRPVAGVDDDDSRDVVVGAPGATDRNAGAAYALFTDCPPRETPDPVEIDADCDDGGGVVRAENGNDETTVRVEVRGPDGFERTVRLDPGERTTFRGLADGDYEVRTFVDGDRIGNESVEIDCEEELEELRVESDCGSDGGKIEVSNPNQVAVTARVNGPDGSNDFELGPGESTRLTGLSDGQYTTRARTGETGESVSVDRSRVGIDCEQNGDRSDDSENGEAPSDENEDEGNDKNGENEGEEASHP